MWRVVFLLVLRSHSTSCQFFDCHDDPSVDPDEGTLVDLQFTWLGALQYIHVKNGTPHYFRVPRVVLISRQFAISTAVDAAHIPDEYALGNIVFGDYERDEEECKLTIKEIAGGMECEPAVLLMPIADVLLHPEFKHFGVKTSIALLKLITPVKSRTALVSRQISMLHFATQQTIPPKFGGKWATEVMETECLNTRFSEYMVPACLPFKNFLIGKNGKITTEKIFHIDFVSDVPRDFVDEEKEVSRLHLLPRELCYLYNNPERFNASGMLNDRIACTTGCGFHSGSPSMVHEHTGHWSIVSLAQGGSPCLDPLRRRRPPPPPRHLLLHPYVAWITAAITGKAVGAFAKDDPFGYVMPRASLYDVIGHRWVGHWWMGGLRCSDRGEAAEDIFRFYHEVFQVKPVTFTTLTYYLEINAAHDTLIICVKVGMPYQIGQPKVWQLDTPEVKVEVPLLIFTSLFKFEVEGWAYNMTESETSEPSSSSIESVSAEGLKGTGQLVTEKGLAQHEET